MQKKGKAGKPKSSSFVRVAVLVDTSTSWGRGIVRGIHRYSLSEGNWQVFMEARGLEERLEVPRGWVGDGIIARITGKEMADQLQALRLPVVNISIIQCRGPEFPRVYNDHETVAEMAAQHLVDRGFRNFAYFSLLGLGYVAHQKNVFFECLRAKGFECTLFEIGAHRGAEPDWSVDLYRLAEWIGTLPKPVGIFTWNAGCAREILYACQAGGFYVPEEVAVLSGSDDDCLCEVSHITISAVMAAAERNGFEAARILGLLMKGFPVRKEPLKIPPIRIVARQSTDTLAIKDPILAKTIAYIRENAKKPLDVESLARQAGISRRALERRFSVQLGRSPAEEIRRAHLERAKELLQQTALSIPEVAESSGFGSPEYMAYIFRETLQLTPLRYRKMARRY
jgi:LacI family transcriptional regulator